MADRPRTFDEVVAAEDPELRKLLEQIETYRDPAVENDFHADVYLAPDRNGEPEWRVEWQDDDGACYVTIFAGPEAERRARGYYEALRAGSCRQCGLTGEPRRSDLAKIRRGKAYECIHATYDVSCLGAGALDHH